LLFPNFSIDLQFSVARGQLSEMDLFKVPLRLLKFAGINLTCDGNRNIQAAISRFNLISITILSALFIAVRIYFVSDRKDLLKVTPFVLFSLVFGENVFNFLTKKQTFVELCKMLLWSEENNHRALMMSKLALIRRVLMTFYGSVVTMNVFLPLILLVITGRWINSTIVIVDWLSFDEHFAVTGILYLLAQWILLVMQLVSFSYEFIFIVFTKFIIMRLQTLKDKMQMIDSASSIRKLAEEHDAIMKLFNFHRLLYRHSIFAFYMASSFFICLSAYQLSTASSMQDYSTFSVFLLSIGGKTFFLSKWCQQIRDSNSEISDCVYFSDWTRKGYVKHRKDLAFIMQRSQHKCSLKVIGYYDISFGSFLVVRKVASLSLNLKSLLTDFGGILFLLHATDITLNNWEHS